MRGVAATPEMEAARRRKISETLREKDFAASRFRDSSGRFETREVPFNYGYTDRGERGPDRSHYPEGRPTMVRVSFDPMRGRGFIWAAAEAERKLNLDYRGRKRWHYRVSVAFDDYDAEGSRRE